MTVMPTSAAGERGEVQTDGSSLALLIVDDDAMCVHASPDAGRILGATREEALGTPLVELIAEDERERFEHIWRALRVGGGHAGPFRFYGAATSGIDIKVTADVLPARHLVLLAPSGAPRAGEVDNGSRSGTGRKPSRRGQPLPSARELEVLRMLAAGSTDGQIATRLSLSPATVRTHVRNAKAKLGASTRAQAVALALERRIIQSG